MYFNDIGGIGGGVKPEGMFVVFFAHRVPFSTRDGGGGGGGGGGGIVVGFANCPSCQVVASFETISYFLL